MERGQRECGKMEGEMEILKIKGGISEVMME